MTAREAIEHQLLYDRVRPGHQLDLAVRIRAVAEAQQALAHRQPDARVGLRGALVDLAAAAEVLADELGAWPAVIDGTPRRKPRHFR